MGSSLLSCDSQSLSSSTSGLCALSLNLKVPEVTETSVLSNLLHTLKIFSESSVNNIGINLAVCSVLNAPLSVQEPLWNSVLGWLGENVADFVDFLWEEVTSSAVKIDLSNLADEDGESSSNTLDDTEGESYLMFSVYVGVLHTNQSLEISCTRQNNAGHCPLAPPSCKA